MRDKFSILARYIKSGIVILLIFFGFYLRIQGIFSLPTHVDESGGVLTSISPEFWHFLDPTALARPLLAYLFYPVIWFSWVDADAAVRIARLIVLSTAVLSGVMLTVSLWLLAGYTAAIVAAALWATTPLLVFHDRLALQDPFTSFFVVTSLFVSLLISEEKQSRINYFLAFISGVILSLAILNKIIAISSVFWCISLLLIYRKKIFLKYKYCYISGFLIGFIAICPELSSYGATLNSSAPSLINSNFNLFNFPLDIINTYERLIRYFGLYNGISFYLVFVSILLLSYKSTVEIKRTQITLVVTLLIESILFIKTSNARYLHASMFFIVIYIALVISNLKISSIFKLSSLLKIKAFCILASIVIACYMAQSLSKIFIFAKQDPLNSDSICSSRGDADYCQYFSWPTSGGGALNLKRLVDSNRRQGQLTNIFVESDWLSATHYLKLSYLRDSNVRVILTPLSQALSAAYLIGWINRYKESNQQSFVVLDSYSDKLSSAANDMSDIDLNGVFLRYIDKVWREHAKDFGYSLYRIETNSLINKAELVPSQPVDSDGTAGPSTLVSKAELAKYRQICNVSLGRLKARIISNEELDFSIEPNSCLKLSDLNLGEFADIRFDNWISEYSPIRRNWVFNNFVRLKSAVLK